MSNYLPTTSKPSHYRVSVYGNYRWLDLVLCVKEGDTLKKIFAERKSQRAYGLMGGDNIIKSSLR